MANCWTNNLAIWSHCSHLSLSIFLSLLWTYSTFPLPFSRPLSLSLSLSLCVVLTTFSFLSRVIKRYKFTETFRPVAHWSRTSPSLQRSSGFKTVSKVSFVFLTTRFCFYLNLLCLDSDTDTYFIFYADSKWAISSPQSNWQNFPQKTDKIVRNA